MSTRSVNPSILVIGGGGREDALVRTLAKSRQLPDKAHLWAAPGNPGMAKYANLVSTADSTQALVEFAADYGNKGWLLTVVGPEALLAAGVADRFRDKCLPIIGPTAAGARIEADKAFALGLMHEFNIPTGRFLAFTPRTIEEIVDAENHAITLLHWEGRIVIKANGLASGKGVRVCTTQSQVMEAMYDILVEGKYGEKKVVVMEHLGDGQEFSVFALVDCNGHIAMLGAAQDHKRRDDDDQGPQTGGMGAYSPVPFVTPSVMNEVRTRIIEPMVRAMAANGTPYSGFLYAGLMMTPQGPKVVEWNCRLGDPETQVILPLLKTDLFELLLATEEGRLNEVKMEFHSGAAACVVLASEGYPEKPIVGRPITGIEQAEAMLCVSVFHAGTKLVDGRLLTAGGRVVGVTAVARDLWEAVDRANVAASLIKFEGKHCRSDIGWKALKR